MYALPPYIYRLYIAYINFDSFFKYNASMATTIGRLDIRLMTFNVLNTTFLIYVIIMENHNFSS